MKKKILCLIAFLLVTCLGCTAKEPEVIEEKETYKVNIEEKSLKLIDAKGPYQLHFSNTSADPSKYEEKWISSDEKICTVKDGLITPLAPGKCHISYKLGDVGTTVFVEVEHWRYYGEAPEIVDDDRMTYFGDILVVNKTYSLPEDYDPGLNPTCEKAFNAMKEAAAEEGINLFILSGYRSYNYQYKLYNKYLQSYSKAETDTFSARPGHSEHQTGLALDLNLIDWKFADTPEGKWLEENCADFGFIIRYTREKQPITGYIYEPWHVRYVGTENALRITASGLCLEEYLGIDSKYQD